MLTGYAHKELEAASQESMARIDHDLEKAPKRIKPLLAFIREHLFDPNLDVNYLKQSCGVRDNSVPIHFHSAVGRPPHRYIEDRRMETACKLLAESSLKIWQIGELLGYSSIQVFSRAFRRWSRQRPSGFRKAARAAARKARDSQPAAEAATLHEADFLRRAFSGELQHDEASALIARLEQMYPGDRPVGLSASG